jgi:hypothetical protein
MSFTPTSRQDAYGFYTVDNLKFYSKVEALEVAAKTQSKVYWNFNDQAFSAYNWKVEPTQSLNELYRERAQQLRDKYDYLVLWYSGGADSTNILDTFVDNNIKLDEVVGAVNYEATGNQTNRLNAEIYKVTVPKIEEVKVKQPWLIHRLVDVPAYTMDFFKDKKSIDWAYNMNAFFNPYSMTSQDSRLKVPEWVKLMDSGKKVGFIYGIDKPCIAWSSSGYQVRFFDMFDRVVSPQVQRNNDPRENVELFYWSPDCVPLMIKQAHVIKNFLKLATGDEEWLTDNRVDKAFGNFTVINKKVRWLDLNMVNKLVYPKWKLEPYQFKAISIVFTYRDDWFYGMSEHSAEIANWRTGLEHMWAVVPDEYKRNKVLSYGLKNFEKVYNIGL